MRKNHHIGLLTILLSLAVLASVGYSQATVNNVYTIPNNFSANQPVLLVAETSDLQEPAYVGWMVVYNPYLGSFNKLSPTKWFCYFSSTQDSNCGPVPFGQGGSGVSFDFDLIAFSRKDISPVKQFSFHPSDLVLVTTAHEVKENYIFIAVAARNAIVQGTPKYTIYKADDLSVFDAGDLERRLDPGDYKLNRTLASGRYYISFEFSTSDKGSGGFVDYIEIGGASSAGSLDSDQLKDQESVAFGERYLKEFSIRNPLSQQFDNLSISIPEDLKGLIDVTLSKFSILSKETIKYTVKADNMRSSMIINSFLELYSGIGAAKKLLNKIPVSLKIDVTGQTGTTSNGPVLSLADPFWVSKEYTVSDDVSTEIDVTNAGTGELEITTEPKEGLATTNIEGIPSPKKISSSGKLKLTIKQPTAKTYKGKITVKSNGGNKDVFVNIRVYDDLRSDLTRSQAAATAQKAVLKTKYSDDVVSGLFSSIDLQLQQVDNSLNTNQYSDAQEDLSKVKAQLDLLGKLPEEPAGGSPLIIIIVVIVIVAVVLFVYKKKLFSKKKKTEEFPGEENFEEEAEPEA